MTYYNMFNNPTAAQNDDIDIVNGALALARTLPEMPTPSALPFPDHWSTGSTWVSSSAT